MPPLWQVYQCLWRAAGRETSKAARHTLPRVSPRRPDNCSIVRPWPDRGLLSVCLSDCCRRASNQGIPTRSTTNAGPPDSMVYSTLGELTRTSSERINTRSRLLTGVEWGQPTPQANLVRTMTKKKTRSNKVKSIESRRSSLSGLVLVTKGCKENQSQKRSIGVQ